RVLPVYSLAPYARLRSIPTRRSSDLEPPSAAPFSIALPPTHTLPPARSVSLPGRPAGPAFCGCWRCEATPRCNPRRCPSPTRGRSEEHTSELQSRFDLVCRLLLEKKN